MNTLVQRLLRRGGGAVAVGQTAITETAPVERLEREFLIERGSLIEGLERVVSEEQPPQPASYWLTGISVDVGAVKISIRHTIWKDTNMLMLLPLNQYAIRDYRVTIPFLPGSYGTEPATQGLTALLKAEPSLTDWVTIDAGADPTLKFRYARAKGEAFSRVSTTIWDWLGGFLTIGGTFRRIVSGDEYDLRTALEVYHALEVDHRIDVSDAAVAGLRDRVSHEAIIRGIPVTSVGTRIAFMPHEAVLDEVWFGEELIRRPKNLYMATEGKEPLVQSVNISPEELTICLRLDKECLQAPEKAEALRALWNGQLQSPIAAATGVPLTTELKQPWKVTYNCIDPFVYLFAP